MQVAKQEHINVEMAIALSKYVHDHCKDVPHDIGLHLTEIVNKFTPEEAIPRDQVRAMLRTLTEFALETGWCEVADDTCQNDDYDKCVECMIDYAMSHPTEAGESQEGKG